MAHNRLIIEYKNVKTTFQRQSSARDELIVTTEKNGEILTKTYITYSDVACYHASTAHTTVVFNIEGSLYRQRFMVPMEKSKQLFYFIGGIHTGNDINFDD